MSGAATVGRLVVTVSGDVEQLAIDMREAQAITGAATKEIVNGLNGITEATSARNDAGKRMLSALQQEIDTFGMTAEQLTIYKASLLGVGDQAAALVERMGQMRAAQAGFNNQLAASEAEATARIREMVAASMQEAAAMNTAASATQNMTAAQTALVGVSRNYADAQRLQAQNMAGVAAAMRSTTDGTAALSAQTQIILNKYDPLGTKLRSLQADLAILRKEMGNSVDPAAIKAFQGLEDEISKTQALMAKAGVEGFGAMEQGAKKGAFATAGATRELIVLGHEVISGNFSRMPGSFMVLAERMSFTSALLNPMTLGFIALGGAAAAVGVAIMQGHDQMVAMNNAMLVTSNYAGMSRLSMNQLAESMTRTHEVTIGAANAIVLALVNSGRIGSESIGQISHFISDFAKSTGQSVDEIAPKMIALFEDPIRGAQELNASMHFLTTTQIEHIAALERTGQAQAAQDVLAQAAANHMPKQAQNIGVVTQAVLDQRDAWAKLWQAMQKPSDSKLGIEQQAQGIRDQISEYLASGLTRKDPAVKTQQAALDALEPLLEAQKEMTQAQKDAAAANELQAKSWDAVKSSSTAYHIQELKDRLTLINEHKSEAGPNFAAQEAAKRDAIRKTNDEIDAAQRSILAEGRQLSQQELANEEALREVKLKATADDVTTLYKLGAISKDEFDRRTLNNTLEENLSKQTYERMLLRVAGLSYAERQAHQQKLELLKAEFDAAENKGVNAQLVDEKKGMDDYITALNKTGQAAVKSLDEQIAKERQRGLEIGLTKAQIEALKSAQERAATEDLQAQSDAITLLLTRTDLTAEARRIYAAMLPDINAQIDAQRTLAQVMGDNATLEANSKAAADAAKAWKHTADTVQNDLTNAILDGGGRGWKKLIRDMEMGFAKMILQPILAPISGGIASILNPLGAQAGAGGALGTAAAGMSAYNSLANIGTTITGVGTLLGSSTIGAFGSGLSAGLAGTSVVDAAAAYGAAGMSGVAGGLSAGASVGSAVSSGTAMLAAIPGWGWAALGAAAIGAYLLNKGPEDHTRIGFTSNNAPGNISINERGNEGRSNTYIGNQGVSSALGTFGVSSSFWAQDQSATVTSFLATVAKTDDALAAFMTTAEKASVSGYLTGKTITANTGKEGADPNANGELDGVFKQRIHDIMEGLGGGLASLTDNFNGNSQALATEAQTILQYRAALKDAGEAVFGAKVTLQELAALKQPTEATSAALTRITGEFNATNAVAASLGKTSAEAFGAVGLASEAARAQLILAAGGITALTQNTSSFAQNYLSDAERLAPMATAMANSFASMGIALPQTRDQFKQLVMGLDLTTQHGATTYENLMNLQDAFSQLHPVIAGTADAVRSAADIATERSNLQDQLDQLTMSQTQLLEKQRNALDAANRPLFDMVQAAQGLAATTANMTKFRDAAKSLHDGLLTGNLSTLTPEQQYAELRRQYDATKAAALGGDTTAQGNVANALTALLTASQKINGGDSQYQADFAMGQQDSASMASWAQGQIDSTQAQLAAMNTANSTLQIIANNTAPINPANYGGADSVAVLASAVKSLQATNADLTAQVAALRTEQQKQTGGMIAANDQSNQANANAIVDGVSGAINRVVFGVQRIALA